MHQQAQLRLNQTTIESLGVAAFVVVSLDLHRTKVFAEKNLFLSSFDNPFRNEKSIVFAKALCDPAGRAAAIYGVSRKSVRWGLLAENKPTWFAIDKNGILIYRSHPTFATPTSYVDDVDNVIDALRKAAAKQ